jgi:hypothetical protein
MALPLTSLSTKDTVVGETPASLATSPMVGERRVSLAIVVSKSTNTP